MGPRFKQSRRFGVNIFGNPKELKRGPRNARRKESEFGKQLNEKQKLKLYYGLSEKQMTMYARNAKRKSQSSDMILGDIIVTTIERRLDNMVYRLGIGRSLRQARQLVNHGHILVNGKKLDIPSYVISVGDVISVREKSSNLQIIKDNLAASTSVLPYLLMDKEKLEGKLVSYPERSLIPIVVTDSLVVEFYAKKL